MSNRPLLDRFVDFSVAVTGYDSFRLHGTGQVPVYFATLTRVVGDGLAGELLQTFERVRTEAAGDATAMERLLRRDIFSDDRLGPIARNVVKLWYVGIWYQLPPEWRDAYGVLEEDTTFVPSPSSYAEGLLWPTIDANP